jgi:hypothetical protein
MAVEHVVQGVLRSHGDAAQFGHVRACKQKEKPASGGKRNQWKAIGTKVRPRSGVHVPAGKQ